MKSLVTICAVVILLLGITGKGQCQGLIAYYPFNGNANDESGNGHNGIVNGPMLVPDRSGNSSSNAYSFDGADDYIDIGEFGDVNTVSLSIWYKSNSANQISHIFGSGTNRYPYDNRIFTLTLELSGVTTRLYYLLSSRTGSSNELYGYISDVSNDQDWHHLVFSRSTNNVSIFLDGCQRSITVVHGDNAQSVNTHKAYFLGAANHDDSWFREPINGCLDDIRIYSRTLTDAEIQGLYRENSILPMLRSIEVSVNLSESGIPIEGVLVSILDANNNYAAEPVRTDETGKAMFPSLEPGLYSAMIVTPLGYTVTQGETQNGILIEGCNFASINFSLSPIDISNNCRTIGYWKHQFNVYTSGRGTAQESAEHLNTYLDLVQQHFGVLQVYLNLENFDFTNAKDVLTVRGGNLMLDRAKQQLFALLLNFASGRVGNETVISEDGRVAAQAVTYVAALANDGLSDNDELAKTICDKINNAILIESGIVPQSNVRYKFDTIAGLPKEFELSQNYPNPFNPTTTIEYGLPRASHVNIQVYDLLGRIAATLANEDQQAGYHQVTWNAADMPSGMYFYRLQAGEFTDTKKMLLMK